MTLSGLADMWDLKHFFGLRELFILYLLQLCICIAANHSAPSILLQFANFWVNIVQCNFCRKRHSPSGASIQHDNSASKLSETGLLYDGQNIHSPTNAALVLENIKQEVESFDADYSEDKTPHSSRRRLSADIHGIPGMDAGSDSVRYSIKACKTEGETLGDGAETVFTLFASLLDSSLQGNAIIFVYIPQHPQRFISFIFSFPISLNMDTKWSLWSLKFHMRESCIGLICLEPAGA